MKITGTARDDNDKHGGLRATLSYNRRTENGQYVSVLEVMDLTSRVTIVEVELTDKQLREMLATSQTMDGSSGTVADPDVMARIGKRIETFSRKFAYGADGMSSNYSMDKLARWTERVGAVIGADKCRAGSHNYGKSGTWWFYTNDMTDQERADIQAAIDAAPRPDSAPDL